MYLLFTGNLRIHAVNVLDKGTYICETINGKTRKLSLEVNTPPVIVAMPDDSGLRVETGETVKITCTGAGFPSPTVMWFHNGAVIGRRKVHSRGVHGYSPLTVLSCYEDKIWG